MCSEKSRECEEILWEFNFCCSVNDACCVCRLAGQLCLLMSSVKCSQVFLYRGADKSLARPGRKQATATEDFEFHISYL